jgi:ATP-grasp domain
MNKPGLGIVYDTGAAGIRDILTALGSEYDLVFIVPRAADPITGVLKSFGAVIPADLPGGISRTAELITRHGIDGLVTYSEQMLRLTADLCEEMNLRGHDVATAMRLTNKKLQREALHAAGIPVPQNTVVSSADSLPGILASVGLPAIIKPLRGVSSTLTYSIKSEKDISRLQRSLFSTRPEMLGEHDNGYIIEELLIGRDCAPFGDYVSVESRTVSGLTSLYAVTGTFPLVAPFREPGQFWPCQLPAVEQDRICETTRLAISALGITDGISHTEIKLTNAGPRIIEVNGRLGGFRADLAARHCGLDLIKDAAKIALGMAETPYQGLPPSRPGVTYSYSSLPPSDACELVSISGRDSLLSAPGVEAYQRYYRNGSKLAMDGRSDPLDVIFGLAPSHQELIPLLRSQLAPLAYKFRCESDYVIKALDLPSAWFCTSGNKGLGSGCD